MNRRIPPLNPLRVFEAVARHENLTKAADELHITQSAVSRHIATLESYLGVQLFLRSRHGVLLTAPGRVYAGEVAKAFATIATATKELTRKTDNSTIRLRVYTTFAMHWLTSRMLEFNTQHPEVELSLNISVARINFEQDDVDMAIQFGDGNWPEMHADLLLADTIEPVCTPEFMAQHKSPDQGPEALLNTRLFHSRYRRNDWEEWLRWTQLVDFAKSAEKVELNNSVLVYQATKRNLGMAMGQTSLLAEEIREGSLICPFNRPLQRPLGYYLLRPKHRPDSRLNSIFRDWLLATINAERTSASA